MAAFTSKATGNWSAAGQTTWNESGVPGDGDTVSIGAHTVTVDVSTTVGTSPNNNTTKVIDITNAAGVLKVAAGVTLTVKGNRGAVNGATFQQEAGSTVTFDNSGSGGSPVYTDVNVGFTRYIFNGAVGNLATIQAIAGQTFLLNGAWSLFTATYLVMRRGGDLTVAAISGNVNISDSLWTSCGKLDCTSTGGSEFRFDRVEFLGGTHATEDLKTSHNAIAAAGQRRLSGCKLDKLWTNNSLSFDVYRNYFGLGFACTTAATFIRPPFENLFKHDGTVLNGGNGALMPGSFVRNYVLVDDGAPGNPHFLAPTAKLAVDTFIDQNVFESHCPDLVDAGDCLLLITTPTSGGNKVVARNNIVIPSSYPGATVTSGALVTLYAADADALCEAYRNTGNVDLSAITGRQGMFDIAEAGNGTAGQVAALKSNLVYGSTAGQGYLAMRVQGDVKDIITAAAADYNWRFNTTAGDNQLGYEDRAAANTIWTAGDAVAAGVDTHGGTGDPQFVDKTRNIASWAVARGYGADYAAGLTALRADPSRTKDLIDYVFEGFKVQNASMRNAAHDGGTVGAANYHDTTRSLTNVTALRTYIGTKYGIAA